MDYLYTSQSHNSRHPSTIHPSPVLPEPANHQSFRPFHPPPSLHLAAWSGKARRSWRGSIIFVSSYSSPFLSFSFINIGTTHFTAQVKRAHHARRKTADAMRPWCDYENMRLRQKWTDYRSACVRACVRALAIIVQICMAVNLLFDLQWLPPLLISDIISYCQGLFPTNFAQNRPVLLIFPTLGQ